ncbi:MAG TPA: phage holin family protein [Trebonia sp.]
MVRISGVRAQSGGASSPDGQPSLGDLVAVAAKDVSQLIRYEIDLAKRELRADVKRAAITGALFGFAAFVACLVLVLLTFALAYGLNAAGVPGGGGLYTCFVYAAVILVLVAGVLAGMAILVMRRFSGMKQTRKTVTDDLSMLRHRDGATASTAPGDALPNGHAAGALSADGPRATAEILDDRS